MSNLKKGIISSIVTIIIGLIWFYFLIPAINIHSIGFWIFVVSLLFIFCFTTIVLSTNVKTGKLENFSNVFGWIGLGGIAIIVTILIINVVLSPLFQSKSYSRRIEIDKNADFKNDVKEVDISQLPLLDKNSSQKLGDRVMGQMPELVSQFYVSDLYTQINYNNQIVRVTPLEYNGLFKYLANKKDGVKGYITVNSVTGDSKLVKLKDGMKIMPSGIFSDDLDRTLRFKYPTEMFGDESFEIDNDGNPYWIIPTLKCSGVGLKKDVSGVIILDPITGNSKKYAVKDVPTWVDHVYPADLIIEQVNNWGEYKEGFLNSIFGQKNVVVTTEGYNYTVMNDDVYLYTGITSVSSDEANVGFILTNMRTKETKYYAVPGAEEYSAMDSAKGQVQQMKYTASFPLLINVSGEPTYLISLKDNAGLVKMYALVNVRDYQKVVVTDSSKGIEKAIQNYIDGAGNVSDSNKKITDEINVKKITSASIEGTTYYYIVDSNNNKYRASIKIGSNVLPFIENGSKIKITYSNKKDVTEILDIE